MVCIPIDLEGKLGVAAFVEAAAETSVPALFEGARAQVPATMLPDEIVLVASLPLTAAGKVDRKSLLAAAGRDGWQGVEGTP